MAETAQLGISVTMKGGREAAVDLDRLAEAGQKAERATIGLSENAEKAAKKIAGANDNVSKAADRLTASYSAASKAAQKLSGAIIGSAIGAALTAAVGRLREMEQVNAQVNKALENAGTMAGHSAESIRRWADELERSTGRAASEVMAVSANLASFGFNEDVFFRAIKLADDMGRAWGGDLRQNLEGLSRALENPEKGLAMLSARGITFTKEGRALAIQLAAIGDSAGAASVLMDELESQVSGVAQAGFTGLTKASAEARRTMNQFFETIVSKSGAMTALEASLSGAAAGMQFLAENADLVMLAVGVLTARIAGPFVAAQVAATGAIIKKNVALLAQTTALYRNVTAANAMAFAARGLSASLALVGGPAGAALLALGGVFYIASQRAQDAQEMAHFYAAAIKKAGENSDGATGGIRAAAAALYEVEKGATAAEQAVTRAAAQTTIQRSFERLEAYSAALRSNLDIMIGFGSTAFSPISRELDKLTEQFRKGQLSAEDFISEVDEIARLNPDASSVIAEIQRIAREAAAAMGVLDALGQTINEVITTGKTSRIGAPEALGDKDFALRFGGWEGVFPSLFGDNDNRKGSGRSGGMSSAQREAERAKKAYADMVRDSQQYIAAQELEQQALYMTAEAADTLRFQQELLNQAANDNIDLTAMAADSIRTKRQELIDLAKDMAGAKAAYDAANEALKFGKDLVRGFVSDLRSGLEQGKGFWRSFGDAAMNVLDKIVDKLLNNVIDALFQVNKAGSGLGGGGGFFGSILGGIGKLFGFASGGYTGPGAATQPAGIVHAGEYVMSKSAVDRLGVGYLDALHNAAKGYQMGGYVRAYAPANVNVRGYRAGGYVQPLASNSAPARIDVYVHAEEGEMFRPVVRAEAQGVAVQVTQAAAPGIVQGSVSATQGAARNRPGFFR